MLLISIPKAPITISHFRFYAFQCQYGPYSFFRLISRRTKLLYNSSEVRSVSSSSLFSGAEKADELEKVKQCQPNDSHHGIQGMPQLFVITSVRDIQYYMYTSLRDVLPGPYESPKPPTPEPPWMIFLALSLGFALLE